ncbi:MAG TPA: type II toxin-antitoxin system death-on-curing family toxin [Candidatus Saccharimonadales bacterium]|nr:type II toxin-antitoxin system death-on-curing family toxin [Candidatus Saccharimonadales bacterium]
MQAQLVVSLSGLHANLHKNYPKSRNLISDHPFHDGNKRTGITTLAMFLKRNGYKMKANNGEIEDFAVKIAVDKLGVSDISTWLRLHSG